MEEEQELDESFQNEEGEENVDDNLEIIMEENNFNYSENNNYSTSKKPQKSRMKSSSSSKYSNQVQTFQQNNQINDTHENQNDNIVKNFNNNFYFNTNDSDIKDENNEEDNINKDINNNLNENIEEKLNNSVNKDNNNIMDNNDNYYENDLHNKIINNEDENDLVNNDNNNFDVHNEKSDTNNNENYMKEDNNINYNQEENVELNISCQDNLDNAVIKDNNIPRNNNKEKIEDENQIELYSYEGNINENINNNDNYNDNINEEYFINQNIIGFQTNFKENKENISDNQQQNRNKEEEIKNETLNKEEIKNDKEKFNNKMPYISESNEDLNNKIKKRSGVIQLNKFSLSNSCNISKEEEISSDMNNKFAMSINNNKGNFTDREKEKHIASQKGALKILQLLISKKQEKEVMNKKQEEEYIDTFKRARSSQLLEVETLSEKNVINENENRNLYNIHNNSNISNNNSNYIFNNFNTYNNNENYKNKIVNLEDNYKNKEKKLDGRESKENLRKENSDKNIDNNLSKGNDNIEKIDKKSFNDENQLNEGKEKNKNDKEIIINNNQNEKKHENSNIINPKIKRINKGKIYIKNSKKVPYRRFKTSNNIIKSFLNNSNPNSYKKSENSKEENIPKLINEKISTISKFKNIQSEDRNYYNNYNNYNFNFNTNQSKSSTDEKQGKQENKENLQIYNKINPRKKLFTPYNNYMRFDQQTSLRNKRKNNLIFNNPEHSMLLYSKPLKSFESSFDTSTIYKRKNIQNKDFSQSPSYRIYSYKRPINQRRNSNGNFNMKYSDNFNINKAFKNKINMKMNKSISPSNYAKKIPSSNEVRKKNNFSNINYNSYNNNYSYYNEGKFNDIHINDSINDYNRVDTIDKNYFNKITKNKNKYLFNSKTSNHFKVYKKGNNFEERDLSSDNINYERYNNKNRYKYNSNINYINKKYNQNTFLKRNNMGNYHYHQRTARNNNSLPFFQPNRMNIQNYKYFNTDDYDNDNDEEVNYENNYIKNNILTNNLTDYNEYDDYDDGNDNNNEYNGNHNTSSDNYYNNKYNFNKNNIKNNEISINIENILSLEEKLNEIIFFLKERKNVKDQCYDFWNYFYNCSLYQKIEKTFKNEKDIEIIKLSINYELLSVMLCYEISFDKKALIKTYILLLEILELNHRNLMIICENILNKIILENQKNIWVFKLNEIVRNSKNEVEKYYQDNLSYSEKINFNTDKISKKIKNILLNYKTEYSSLINSLFRKIEQKTYEEINDFFREYILRIEKNTKNIQNNSLKIISTNSNFVPVRPPYILSPREKPYTLVLGLDETLVNFQQINYTQGVLKLRPFLIEFLENVSQYYELILFTTETQYYAEPIIKAIEQKKNYFDFVFYRENCVLIGNDYVKDLARIGRPLDSTIIVDNIPQYFRFQKENGIIIKSFWAQDPNDMALYDLIPILMNIAEEGLDVRDGIDKYSNEIAKKVSSNINKNYI